MPLHDWTERDEWEGMHTYWMTEIAQWLKHRLPPGYRAIIGTSPFAQLSIAPGKPDVSVANGTTPRPHSDAARHSVQPDFEAVVATLEEDHTVLVAKNNRLIAAVEIISPANKDRPERRDRYAARYLGYLRSGIHLMIVDVHARPRQFSFAQRIGNELDIERPAPVSPCVASYQVGPGAPTGGRFLSVWQRELAAAAPLPSLPLCISQEDEVSIDLEATYMDAARKAYVEE
jgi:hypothetical protein